MLRLKRRQVPSRSTPVGSVSDRRDSALIGSVFFFALAAGAAPAQVISGTVTDVDGMPVPNASVQATNKSTGVVTKIAAARKGAYSFSKLPA